MGKQTNVKHSVVYLFFMGKFDPKKTKRVDTSCLHYHSCCLHQVGTILNLITHYISGQKNCPIFSFSIKKHLTYK